MIKKNKILASIAALAAIITVGLMSSDRVYAAGEGSISISEDNVKLDIGETTVITVDYNNIAGGFADLAVISADTNIAATIIADAGNNKASIAIGGLNMGTTAIAVYRVSNPAVIDYVAVQCGLAEDGQIINQINGNMLTTIFDDRIINYGSILNGKNNEERKVHITRNRGG